MKKLIPMSDFVIALRDNKKLDNVRRFWACERYADFLKQSLRLSMFVPCNEFEEPFDVEEIENSVMQGTDTWDGYQNAEDRILFKGFTVDKYLHIKHPNGEYLDKHKMSKLTVEDIIKEELTLTPYAIKQIRP